MKKLLFLPILSILFLFSCEKEIVPSLQADRTSIEFLNIGNTEQSISIMSNTSWSISGIEGWLTVSPTSGNGNGTIVISAKDNTSSTGRSCSLQVSTVDNGEDRVSGEHKTVKITVKQEASFLSVDKDELSFESDEGSQGFQVSSNTSWIITGQAEWITVTPSERNGNAKVTIAVSQNNSTNDRVNTFEVRTADGSLSNMIKVTQKAMPVSLGVSSENIRMGYEEGSTGEITITSNSTWTLSYNATWFSVSTTAGTGSMTLKITAMSENFSDETRSAPVTVVCGDTSASFIVIQEPELAPNCRISTTNEVLMHDGIAGSIKFGSSAVGYIERYYYATAADTYTEKEIYVDVKNNGSRWSTDYSYFTSGILDPNTEYVYCAIAYNSDGQLGKMLLKRFRTPATTTNFDAPISNLWLESGYWYATISKNTRCARYYLFAYMNSANFLNYPDALIVYAFLQDEINKYPDDYIINNNYTFYLQNVSNEILLITWGVSDKGEFSNELRLKYGTVSSQSLKKIPSGKTQSIKI